MSIITRLWHWLFPVWKKTAEEEFGVGNFRYVTTTYAKSGDKVTCENGHTICIFCRNVDVGGPIDLDAFGSWLQPPPKIGDTPTKAPCTICGARWFKGPYFHFPDGWRIGVDSWTA